MVDISAAGLIGAFIGTAIAGVNYHLLVGALERRMLEGTKTAAERDAMETRLSLMRRLFLIGDLFVFAALGYWIGVLVWN